MSESRTCEMVVWIPDPKHEKEEQQVPCGQETAWVLSYGKYSLSACYEHLEEGRQQIKAKAGLCSVIDVKKRRADTCAGLFAALEEDLQNALESRVGQCGNPDGNPEALRALCHLCEDLHRYLRTRDGTLEQAYDFLERIEAVPLEPVAQDMPRAQRGQLFPKDEDMERVRKAEDRRRGNA